jgi:hypothetical protein
MKPGLAEWNEKRVEHWNDGMMVQWKWKGGMLE